MQWINVTIAVEATCHDLGWKDFENCVLKMLKVFLKWCKKTQTKNCKNYLFHSSKTRVISSQSIYNARNAKTTSDSSFFMKVWACDNHIKKPAKFTTDLI